MRLGIGEFFDPRDPSWPRVHAQFLFFRAMNVHVPAASEELRDRVLPVYASTAEGTYPRDEAATVRREVGHLTGPLPSEAEASLRAWASRWHLGEEWILDYARRTLRNWNVGLGIRSLTWILPSWSAAPLLSSEDQQFSFTHPGWQADWHTRPEAAEEIRNAFSQQLSVYLDRIERLAVERGWQRTPEKRSVKGPRSQAQNKASKLTGAHRHFDWLALYQVNGSTYGEIARKFARAHEAIDAKMVAAGTHKAAAEVGLALRTSTRRRK